MPLWTWALPLPIFHLATRLSLTFTVGTGVSICYLPIPVGIVLCFWWGPARVLPAMYANALIYASRWGLHDVDNYPVYALWEVLAVGISWFVFTKWKKGKPWLPDLRETSRFVFLVAAPASVCNGLLVSLGLLVTADISWNDFPISVMQGTVATLFDTLGIAAPILLWFTPWMEEKGWSRTNGSVSDKERAWDRIRFLNLKTKHYVEIVGGFLISAVLGWYMPSLEYWFAFGLFVLWAALRYGVILALAANIWVQIFTLILPAILGGAQFLRWSKDGQTLVFFLNLALLCFIALMTGRATSDTGTELRKRRRVEARLIFDREQYRKFFEENLSANFIADAEGNLLAVNASFLRMFGFDTQSEAIEKNLADLFPSYDDYSLLLKKIDTASRLESHEEFFLNKNGSPLHTTGNYFASRDREGKIGSIRGYILDDTLRRKLESQLIESKKLETIGTLAGGIAHDFNNILQIISGYATRMELESRKSDSLLDASRSINAAAGRGATIVRRLLSLARKGGGGFKSISINRLVEDTLSLLVPTFPKEISFQKEISLGLPEIVGDYSQLEQVLINLCINSRDALPNGGRILLRAFLVEGKSIKSSYPLSEPAEYICLEISDNGEGMNEETKKRVFEPFFTTKSRSQGSGLGMSMVYGIIQSHEGIIQIGSELGRGTNVRLFFPTASRKIFSFEKEETGKMSGSNAETVLLVLEEEPYLSDLVRDQVEDSGIRAIAVNEFEKVSELLQKFRSSIGLFVLDLDFPNPSLFSFLERIKLENPELKTVVSGTEIGQEEKDRLLALGIKDTIEKPYKIRDLIGLLYTKKV